MVQETAFYNACPAAGCHQYCVLKVWVKDGKICKIESPDYPGDPMMRAACLKGLASMRLVYHPDRLKYPMKRIGERGEGKWQRITWDEAFDTIASKLLKVKEKYGAESVKILRGGSSSVGLLMGRLVATRFANVWGSGGNFEVKSSWQADTRVPAASLLALGDSGQSHRPQDIMHSKMVIIWGGNPAETYFPEMRHILNARDNGTKLVVIGPLFDATAAKADQWIPVRPATDAALAMAMMNVIIKEKLYDKDYITKYTVGPLLVRGDSKLFLRDADKYLVWDEDVGAPHPQDSAASPAILGSFTVRGINCKPAFQLLAERVAPYTPEKAAEITGVPAETIRKLALEYANSKPAAIRMHFGMARTLNSTLSCRSIITLAAITGNIGKPGGGASVPWIPPITAPTIFIDERPVTCPPGASGVKSIPGTKSTIRGWAAIREGKPYPVKVILDTYRNAAQHYGNIEGYKEIYAKMDLIVSVDIFMTRSAKLADIVLPDATVFERDDIMVTKDYVVRLEKAIEPVYEARSSLDIWSELARRVGLGEYFKYTARDYMKMLLASKHPSIAGITLERLEKEKIVRGNVPLTLPVPFADNKFPTPSGRIEFYNEHLVEFEQELPVHRETLESPRCSHLAQKYPLTFISAKTRATTHSIMANVDWMQEISPEPLLDINPVDAQKRGIEDNDLVVVFNDRGKVKLKARCTEAVPPGTINIPHGWWPERFTEGHYSDLLHRIDDLSTIDPALEREPITSDFRTASSLIHYDCLAEVQKDLGAEDG